MLACYLLLSVQRITWRTATDSWPKKNLVTPCYVSNNVVYIRSTCTSGGFIPAKQILIMFPSQICNRWITSRKTLQSISGVYTRSSLRSSLSTTTLVYTLINVAHNRCYKGRTFAPAGHWRLSLVYNRIIQT